MRLALYLYGSVAVLFALIFTVLNVLPRDERAAIHQDGGTILGTLAGIWGVALLWPALFAWAIVDEVREDFL